MSEIDDAQRQIEELLARLAGGAIKDVKMSVKMELLRELNNDKRVAEAKDVLQVVNVLPDFFRQFKGELNLQEWVSFIIKDLGPELAPLKEFQILFDQYFDARLDKTAERVLRLTKMGLGEETALKIVQGLAKDIVDNVKKGSESAASKKPNDK